MIIFQGDKEVTISDLHWPLAEPLLTRWGYEGTERIKVHSLNDVTAELSVWGIPWKRTKWNYE